MEPKRLEEIENRVKLIEDKIGSSPLFNKDLFQKPVQVQQIQKMPKKSFGKRLLSPFRKGWYTPDESCDLSGRNLQVSDFNCKAKIGFKIILVLLVITMLASLIITSINALFGIFSDWRVGSILTVIFFTTLILLLPTILFAFVGEKYAKISFLIFLGLIIAVTVYIILMWNGLV